MTERTHTIAAVTLFAGTAIYLTAPWARQHRGIEKRIRWVRDRLTEVLTLATPISPSRGIKWRSAISTS